MRAIAESALFDAVIVGIILMNTVVLALYHYGINKSFEKVLDLANMVSKEFYFKPQVLREVRHSSSSERNPP